MEQRDGAAPVVDSIVAQLLPLYRLTHVDSPDGIGPELPHHRRVVEALELLLAVLLPAGSSPEATRIELMPLYLHERLSRATRLLTMEVARALPLRWRGAYAREQAEASCRERCAIPTHLLLPHATELMTTFARRLPVLREQIIDDITAAYNGDPAAMSYAEVMLTYPGLRAIASHRVAHELHELDVPVVPRIMSEHTHAAVGVDIHPGARIGRGFFIDHATGVVIGETATVGDNVKLYQGVTLGARSFPLDEYGHPQKKIRRHPTVEDGVIIYANATILGPVTIGAGSEIGGNVFLTHDIPAGSRVRGRNEIEVKAPGD
jgi:serine O-acetyltransferase